MNGAAAIRAAVHVRLRPRLAPGALLMDELGVDHGGGRVDVAVITPRRLAGYEIKGDADSLRRLPGQLALYGRVLHRLTLVVAARHLARAERLAPEWCGILVAGEGGLRTVRRARTSPCVSLLLQARLLWRDEAEALLRSLGPPLPTGLARLNRERLCRELAGRLSAAEVARQVHRHLARRRSWSRDRVAATGVPRQDPGATQPEPPSPCV